MTITTEKDDSGKQLTIAIEGMFDFNLMHKFKASYGDVQGIESYILDFSGVDYMDSSALGMLLNMRKVVDDSSRIVIKDAQPAVGKILAMSRFDKKFEIES